MKGRPLRDVAHFKGDSKKVLDEIVRKPEIERQERVKKVLEHFSKEDKKIRAREAQQEVINRARSIYRKIRGGKA